MDLGLRGKVVIVTGATKGLGRAITEAFLAEGAQVSASARTEADIADLQAWGNDRYPGQLLAVSMDVTQEEELSRLVGRTIERFGKIQILVNNAGRATPGTFETLTDEQWQADLDVKLFPMIRLSRLVLPHLRQNKGGRIININAVFGKMPDPTFFATSTNRAACIAFTKALSREVAAENILVNNINIGFVRSAQWENIRMKRAPELSEEQFFDRMAKEYGIPMQRFGEASEVAHAVLYLASKMGSYVSGASLDLDGGFARYS